jgi:hypothetical protein
LGAEAQVSFAPVRIAPEGAAATLADAGMIEIEFASGTRMRIRGTVDVAALAAAVAALAGGRRR